jgi:hypothetical protein
MSSRRVAAQQFTGIAALALLLVLYLPLATNPGWFSHDELQWGAPAQVARPSDLPWVAWSAVETFQWRPLTFNLWLLASWATGASPAWMHALWLVLGAGISALLYSLLRAGGTARGVAAAAVFAFAINPFAVYVHGWTATLAELLWVGFALGIGRCVLGVKRDARTLPALAGAIGTGLALMSKEAALAIAPLLLLAWWISAREPRWIASFCGALLPTVAYLGLRLPVLLFDPRPFDGYAWSLGAIPTRWIEMQTWPFLVTTFELVGVMQASGMRLLLATTLAALLAVCIRRASIRLLVVFFVGGILSMGPSLVLLQPYPQYGYAWSALACACLALAWPRSTKPWRAALLLALLLSGWHGFNVQREMRRVGELERGFTPTLRELASQPTPLRLYVENAGDAWIYERLLVPIEGIDTAPRAALVVDPNLATHRIAIDGNIVPL